MGSGKNEVVGGGVGFGWVRLFAVEEGASDGAEGSKVVNGEGEEGYVAVVEVNDGGGATGKAASAWALRGSVVELRPLCLEMHSHGIHGATAKIIARS